MQLKDVKVSDKSDEKKNETVETGPQESQKSDETQSAQSSVSSTENLKVKNEKPSSPVKEERKGLPVTELNNNIANKLSKSLPTVDPSSTSKPVRQNSTGEYITYMYEIALKTLCFRKIFVWWFVWFNIMRSIVSGPNHLSKGVHSHFPLPLGAIL